MECVQCALAWDEDDARPPCLPLTYRRLREAALDAAELLEQSQRAAVLAGYRKFRYQPRLKLAMELRAIVRMIDKLTPEKKTGGQKQ
jgi:hypothetical protein